MLVEFDFAVTQLRYFKAAMDLIPTFRPDGKTPVQVQAVIDSAASVRTQYVEGKNSIDGARALRRVKIEQLHEGCVDFSAQARSRYRKVPEVLERVERLPIQDRTFQETLTRADAISALWVVLPNVERPSGTPGPFTYLNGTDEVTLAEFAALITAARAADTAIPATDQTFQSAEATMHLTQADMEDFSQAAFAQGRSQFPEGSAEREIIDAVPEEPASGPPSQAAISSAVLTGAGEVTLQYDADGATTFDVLNRPPGGSGFAVIAADTIEREFVATGLATGEHAFKVIGRNSRGEGPESEESTVTV